jgi:hypothetical protein
MSKETPNDHPRQRTDWKNTKQTDEPWKGRRRKSRNVQVRHLILKSGTSPTRIEGSETWQSTSRSATMRARAG